MPEELPKGWAKTTLGEVCAMNPPFAEPLSDHTEVSFVPMAAVEEETGHLDASQIRPLASVRIGYTPFKENDVVFAKITPSMENGKIALAKGLKNGFAYGSTELFVFRPYEGLLPRFLLYFLLQPSFREDAERHMTGAVGQKRVPANYLFTHELLLPPTPEQERIVAKLDAALSGLERAAKASRRAQERIKRYRAAVLQSAIAGDLTSAWRESQWEKKVKAETDDVLLHRLLTERRERWEESELKRFQSVGKRPKDNKWKSRYPEPTPLEIADRSDLPRGWSWTNMSQLKVHSLYGPRFSGSDYTAEGVAVLRTTDIDANGRVSLETCPKLPLSAEEYEKYKVEIGDLLITRTGSIGTIAIFNDEVRAIPGAYLLHYRLVDTAVVPFIYTFFRSPSGQEQLWEASVGSGRQNLSAPELERIPIPLPPIDEQAEIVQEVERRLSAADRLATTLEQQLSRALVARQSLLSEAFTGCLLPQDPKDEPASALLSRIRIARETEARAPKVKRMSKLKPKMTRRPLLDVLRENNGPITPEQLFIQAGFKPAQVDLFYRELALLRDKLTVEKPRGAEVKSWPAHARVTLQLKEN
jgi:type I restriction enzyme, S subunit